MTTAILIAGLALVAALAILILRPRWRLPAVAFGTLAIPGNVDNLLPQMTLDPHRIADVSAPAVSVVDLLLAFALVVTVAERRRPDRFGWRMTILAAVVTALAWIAAGAAAASGVEIAAVVRGAVVFARLPALFFLASALRAEIGDATRLAMAILAGGIALLGNGIYTTVGEDLDRFTARTFGRNGFAIILVFVVVVGTAFVYRRWDAAGRPALDRLVVAAAAVIVAASLFGASATGTRMGSIDLLVLAPIAFLASPSGWSGRVLRGALVTAVAAVVVLGASVVWTSAGSRTVSVLTDPDTTVDVVMNPGDLPTETEIRSRGQFWQLAIDMAKSRPLTGVGPFQWNIVRYRLDPKGPVVVADAHNTYLQVAAEYGVVVLAGYVALLAGSALVVVRGLWSRAARRRLGWAGLGLAIAALVFPLADVTNSHFFNVRNGLIEWLAIAVAVSLAAIPDADEDMSGRSGPP